MTITLVHALAGVLLSAVILILIAFLAVRTTHTAFPVRCVHCWKYAGRETIISYSETEEEWGICPQCVENYWQFSNKSSDTGGS